MSDIFKQLINLDNRYRKHLLLGAEFKFYLLQEDLRISGREEKKLIENIIKRSNSVIRDGLDLVDAVKNIVAIFEEEEVSIPSKIREDLIKYWRVGTQSLPEYVSLRTIAIANLASRRPLTYNMNLVLNQ